MTTVIEHADSAAVAAQLRRDQAIEWEVSSGRTSEVAAAAQLGVQSRKGVRAARARAVEAGHIKPANLPPVVYVRGAGRSQQVWDDVAQACAAWGLVMVRDRTQAWHLARGGCPVWLLDMTVGLAAILTGRVRARYADDGSLDLPALTELTHHPREVAQGVRWVPVSAAQMVAWVAAEVPAP